MPIYEYQCHECQQIFEEWQTNFENKKLECPVCEGVSTKVLSNSSFVLKGGGWYSSGYCKTDSSAKESSCSTDSTKSDSSIAESSDSAPKSSDNAVS